MPITITVETSEPFQRWVNRNRQIAERAVTEGVRAGTRAAQLEIRQQMTRQGLGTRFPNAVRSAVYPEGQDSLGAAGSIYARGKRADEILSAFAKGVTIRAKHGTFLAVPTPAAGTGPRGKRITPGIWEAQHGQRLRFIYRRGAPSLLVAEGFRASFRRATGELRGFRRSRSKTGRGSATVIMFILVPQVRLRKRLSPDRIIRKWIDQIPGLIERALPRDT